ncbi:MAG: UDP-N-acetylmuramoyl-L-alanyl-D-glutamate--2,6-diaminopimelate ligase [Planctomycetota bacterium]|nr:MAG: UDP-N-acetylmuramoyl-L-alanyl-D-glutamate--2,6-diaminopimelate ligase [Planctomycetota bacterium]
MRKRRLKELLGAMEYKLIGESNPLITGLAFDSRQVKPGYLYFAMKGTQVNGVQFIPEAIQKGACAIVVEEDLPWKEKEIPLIRVPLIRKALGLLSSRFYRNPTHHLSVIGITGTNGKTTTSYFLRSIFQSHGWKTALLGTIENLLGEKSLPSTHTTPSSLDIHQFACQALEEKCQALIMEASSHGLSQGRVEGVDFDGAIFTNLTGDHLDYHKTMEDYGKAKSILFEILPPHGKAILNLDDPSYHYLIQKSLSSKAFYGIQNPKAMYKATHIQISLQESRFILEGPTFRIPVHLPFIGIHNIYNSLAAAAMAHQMGIHPACIQRGLETALAVPGRLEPISNNQGIHVFVDYAHTDDALQNVLSKLAQLKKGRIITVFGCGGNRDKTKRPRMAQVASKWSDWTILTSDNPRREDPLQILKDIEEGMTTSSYEVIEDRKTAIFHALRKAKKGDIVLIAGKGHENYQEGSKGRIWFDDRVVAKEFFKKFSINHQKKKAS